MKGYIEKIPLRIWILVLIILVGIFLRTYNFRDWLVFNPDQARDAKIVGEVLNGEKSWLILGPEAGNNRFDLGPWFYHLEIVSAKIFGNTPDKMAYPDLFFSILSIPLFYVFLKKYFRTNLSLALTGLYSISFFAITYSRFAWNPNSIPFFVLLFLLGILQLVEPDKKKKFWGAAMVGSGIGVGMQLHILLLFIMPAVVVCAIFYLFLKKYSIRPLFAKIGIILLLVFATNVGQIAFEAKNGIWNTRKFVKELVTSTKNNETKKNLPATLFCQAQANLYIVSSLGVGEKCNFSVAYQKFLGQKNFFSNPNNTNDITFIFLGIAFLLGGYALLFYFWKNEKNESRKYFLAVMGIFGATTFAATYPVIDQVETRYYIVSFFLPFIFLGLIMDALLRRKKIWAKIVATLIFVLLLALNGEAVAGAAGKFLQKTANDSRNSYLGETEQMADFLVANSNGSKTIYIAGDIDYVQRYSKPMGYFIEKSGIKLERFNKGEDKPESAAPLFFIYSAKKPKYWIGSKIGKYEIKNHKIFGNIDFLIPNE